MNSRDWLNCHPLFRVTIFLIIGIVIADRVGDTLPASYWLAGIGVFLLLSQLFRQRHVQGFLLLLTTLFLGGWLMAKALADVRSPLPEGEQLMSVVVVNQPAVHGKVLMCDLMVTNGPLTGRRIKASILRDTIECRYSTIREGCGLLIRSRLEHNQNYQPGNFNYIRWLEAHGFVARTFIYYDNWVHKKLSLRNLSAVERLRLRALQVRRRLADKYRQLGLEGEQYAIVSAMSLGDKSALGKSTRNIFQQTGAAHVLALSGLHLSVIYFFLAQAIRMRRNKVISQILLIFSIWAFAFLTGLSVSLVRAATMLTIYSMVDIMQRSRATFNTLSLTVLLLLIANPLSIFDISFQLSVMAVLSLMIYTKPLYYLIDVEFLFTNRNIAWLWSMLVVSFSAQLGAAPLIIYYFGQFPPYFLLTNFLAVPLTTFILLGCLLLLIFNFVPVLSGVLVSGVGGLAWLLSHGLRALSALPGSSLEIRISQPQLIAIYVLIACGSGCVYYYLKIRRARGHLAGVPSGS